MGRTIRKEAGVGVLTKGPKTLTLFHTGPRQGILTKKVIPGFPVIILYHKTQHGEFRHLDLETQCLSPLWVKTCSGDKCRGIGIDFL